MSEEKKEPRTGSARAKLEAFDRKEKGQKLLWRKLLLMAALLAAVVVIKLAFDHFTDKDTSWFDNPKNIAWMMREGHWDQLEPLIAKDVEVLGGPAELESQSLIEYLKSQGDRLQVFATHPHRFGDSEKGHWVSFFGTRARGNLEKTNSVPLVQTWLINAEMAERDGAWVVVKVQIQPTISTDGAGGATPLPK